MSRKGFSLLEVLVVLAVFSLLALVSTTAVLLAVRGAQKSSTTARVRENVDFTVATVERQVRNAKEIVSCDNNTVVFTDQESNQTSFACVNIGSVDAYVASSSARLTSSGVIVSSCSISCSASVGSTPPSVTFSISAKDKNATGTQGSMFSTTTQVFLRTY